MSERHEQGFEAVDATTRLGDGSRLSRVHGGDWAAGDRVGRYLVESLVARGGAGSVYRAREIDGLKRRVALKCVGAEASASAYMAAVREGRVLDGLVHEGIARVFDAGPSARGGAFVAMEWIDGVPLSVWLAETKPDLVMRLRVMAELCEAVDFAHRKGVLHRDIKPSNIMVRRASGSEPHPVLIDFGIAAMQRSGFDECGRPNQAGDSACSPFPEELECSEGEPWFASRNAGTVEFMAPETLDASGQDGVSADIYALGVVFHWILTERLPFGGRRGGAAEMVELIRRIRTGDRPVVGTEPAPLVVALEDRDIGDIRSLLEHALHVDPRSRLRSAEAFASECRLLIRRLPTESNCRGRRALVRRMWHRHRARVISALSLAGACLAITSASLMSGIRDRAQRQVLEGVQREQERAIESLRESEELSARRLQTLRDAVFGVTKDLRYIHGETELMAVWPRVIELHEAAYGRSDARTLDARLMHAESMLRARRFAEAREFFGQIVSAADSICCTDGEDPSIARRCLLAARGLVFALDGLGSRDEALAAGERLLSSVEQTLEPCDGVVHPWSVCTMVGELRLHVGDMVGGLELMQRGVGLSAMCESEHGLNWIQASSRYADALARLGDEVSALAIYEAIVVSNDPSRSVNGMPEATRTWLNRANCRRLALAIRLCAEPAERTRLACALTEALPDYFHRSQATGETVLEYSRALAEAGLPPVEFLGRPAGG